MLMALRLGPSSFFLKGKVPLRKNLLGSKRKTINIYFACLNMGNVCLSLSVSRADLEEARGRGGNRNSYVHTISGTLIIVLLFVCYHFF